MLIVDYPVGPAFFQPFYCKSVTLLPNTDYCFSAYFINLDIPGTGVPAPAVSFIVNGANLFTSPLIAEDGLWHNYGVQFNSGAGGVINVCLNNANCGSIAFHLGVDDISLYPTIVGTPPNAIKDNASVCNGSSVLIPVLTNDLAGGSAIQTPTLSISTNPTLSQGIAVISAGKILFTPAIGFIGSATFSYRVCDANGCCDTASVTVNVKSATNNNCKSNECNFLQYK